jgi:hypothetical protein
MDFVPGPNDDWGPDEASEGVRQAEGDRHSATSDDNARENGSPRAIKEKTD